MRSQVLFPEMGALHYKQWIKHCTEYQARNRGNYYSYYNDIVIIIIL